MVAETVLIASIPVWQMLGSMHFISMYCS